MHKTALLRLLTSKRGTQGTRAPLPVLLLGCWRCWPMACATECRPHSHAAFPSPLVARPQAQLLVQHRQPAEAPVAAPQS